MSLTIELSELEAFERTCDDLIATVPVLPAPIMAELHDFGDRTFPILDVRCEGDVIRARLTPKASAFRAKLESLIAEARA